VQVVAKRPPLYACKQCDQRFELVLNSITNFFRCERTVKIRPRSHPFQSCYDGGTVLSGVEITVIESQYRSPVRETTVFLWMAELQRLVNVLDDDLAIYKKQFDWTCDWTW
jgi:hypothetical protein